MECLHFSHPGSRMGHWDHCMLLQTPSTSVPAMVSMIPSLVGDQNPAVQLPLPSLSSDSQELIPWGAEKSPFTQLSLQTCPLLQKPCYREQSDTCCLALVGMG